MFIIILLIIVPIYIFACYKIARSVRDRLNRSNNNYSDELSLGVFLLSFGTLTIVTYQLLERVEWGR